MAEDILADLKCFEIPTPPSGIIKVFVQGNLDERQGKTIFITCHDIGANYKSLAQYVMNPCMTDVRNKSIFLHVCVVGQEDNAPNLPNDFVFPTLDKIAEDLSFVLDYFNFKTAIGFGEGAGANIICRFAMMHSNRCLGIVLVHCTSTTAGVVEYIKDKMIGRKLSCHVMNQSAFDYLIFHKFGSTADDNPEKVAAYLTHVKEKLNPYNMSLYLDSFMRRTDLSTDLAEKLQVDALLVVGSRASHLHTVYTMHQSMSKLKSTLLVVDDVGDVISEAPEKLTRALILFGKGCGVMNGISIPGMDLQRTLSSSMEDADRPRKLSLTKAPSPHA
ncbi:Uncharacterized protein T02_8218 [Trichinella nativa]|uniref:Ndr family protein n=2 Tax=Trichinella TaxID=6333 RepID=A0A0V1L4H8_9BILA|nr:Uncharacterized protein T09_6876 [Trichinella sp. T9]KRY48953.1 Uncharacterized protein T03_10731 [Trichinella britovi]KRZ54326.1 Uncharacterized protein T02_8218 [Trichinella nativa]KRZ96977.1 Uncharacterized protein T08_11255 [Trichinella sp. T8]